MQSFLSVLGIVAFGASLPAHAVTTVYTSQSSFNAAVASGSYTETFMGAVDFQSSFSFSGNGFGYTVTALNAPGDVYLSGSFVGNGFGNEPLTVTFTTGNVTAVGGNFFISNLDDAFVSAPVTLTLGDGTVTNFSPATYGDSYRGFVSTVPIASLSFAVPGTQRFNTIDNLTVGVGVVPEPATWVLMAFGVAGLLSARRKRIC